MSIAALLSRYVPVSLALKGLSKVNPKVGKFIVDATAYGYGGDKILDYLRNQFDSSTQGQKEERARLESGAPNLRPDELASLQGMKQREAPAKTIQKGVALATGLAGGLSGLGEEEQPQQTREGEAPAVQPMQEAQIEPKQQRSAQSSAGTLQALSPKLMKFVEDRLSQGSPLSRIAGLAKAHFFDEINKIQQETGMEFSDFLESLYGAQNKSARAMGLGQQSSDQGKQQLASTITQAVQLMKQLRGK